MSLISCKYFLIKTTCLPMLKFCSKFWNLPRSLQFIFNLQTPAFLFLNCVPSVFRYVKLYECLTLCYNHLSPTFTVHLVMTTDEREQGPQVEHSAVLQTLTKVTGLGPGYRDNYRVWSPRFWFPFCITSRIHALPWAWISCNSFSLSIHWPNPQILRCLWSPRLSQAEVR